MPKLSVARFDYKIDVVDDLLLLKVILPSTILYSGVYNETLEARVPL